MPKIIVFLTVLFLCSCSEYDRNYQLLLDSRFLPNDSTQKLFQTFPLEERIRLYKINNKISAHSEKKLYLYDGFKDMPNETFKYIANELKDGNENDFNAYHILLIHLVSSNGLDLCMNENKYSLNEITKNDKIKEDITNLFLELKIEKCKIVQ